MQFRSTIAVIAALVTVVSARMISLSVPKKIKIGERFDIKVDTVAVEPSDWKMVVAFGIADVSTAAPGTLGRSIGWAPIPDGSCI